MTAAVRLPDHAPFPPDAIAALNSVIARTNPAQRAWLSGFLAGLEAASGAAVAAPAPAPAPVAKQPLLIVFATEGGNAEALAGKAKKDAAKQGFAPRVLDAADVKPEELAKAKNLLLIASTWGEGDPPQRAAGFYKAIMGDGAPRLDGLRYAVLALGDRAYVNFCETGRRLDERLAALGAARAAERIECDLDYDKPALAWIGKALPELRGKDEPAPAAPGSAPGAASVIHVDFGGHAAFDAEEAESAYDKSNPFPAEITDLVNLNSSRSAKQTTHVELQLEGSGILYQPGDALGVLPENDPAVVETLLSATGHDGDEALRQALTERHDVTTLTAHLIRSYAELTGDPAIATLAGDPDRLADFLPGRHVHDLFEIYPNKLTAEQLTGLLRPLPPRLYSIASSRASVGEEAHLLISTVRYHAHGRDRGGVASTHVSDRRRAGDHLKVYLKPNPRFRLPADPATPIVMVGPGTGIAPFRAFMQERDAAGIEGKSWLFFGDQRYTHDFLYQIEWQDLLERGVLGRLDVAFSRDQPEKRYVQHRMWEERRDLYAWLQEGAAFYICGDQSRMAKDVHDTLRDVIADGAGVSAERAEEDLDTMKRQGRYLLDVY